MEYSPPTVQNASSDQQGRFNDAFNDLEKRIHANGGKNPCADLFGGVKKADKALKDTKFSIGQTREGALAQALGKNVTINPNNGFFRTTGNQTIQVGLNPRGPSLIKLSDVEIGSFVLAHELDHRTGKLINDSGDRDPTGVLSILNNGAVHKACFGDVRAHSNGLP